LVLLFAFLLPVLRTPTAVRGTDFTAVVLAITTKVLSKESGQMHIQIVDLVTPALCGCRELGAGCLRPRTVAVCAVAVQTFDVVVGALVAAT
jgi:hypothetical protein